MRTNHNQVGKDSHRNEYYENRADYHGRDRWVLYNKWNFDASQVPPEWHQWVRLDFNLDLVEGS